MRAIAVDRFKDEPRLVELPIPTPKPDQLLVKILATAINPFDWKLADGLLDGAMPSVFPFVLGQDAAGRVAAVGDAVTRFKVGDRVFGQFFHSPLGEGTFAEYAVVPESTPVVRLPDAIDDRTAAALPTAGMTALAMIQELHFAHGARVLITGATGGVGGFATQFAASRGFRVLATAGAAVAERMRGLGAAETFDARSADLVAQVRRAHPDGIDGLIDLVDDAAEFTALLQLVRKGGHALSTVFAADEQVLRSREIDGGNFSLKASASLLHSLIDAVTSAHVKVQIDSVIALEDAPAAIARSRAGHSRGKTIIEIGPASES